MIMIRIILTFFITAFTVGLFAQESENKIKVKLGGFVKNDMFWDSRQTVSAREGHFLLFPAAESLDLDGNDVNGNTSFNFLSIQSRVGISVSGAKALNADISAKIEGDFFGQANDNINLFRLRHAFIKMKWESTELLVGQYWIPMFVTDCFPGTVSFNTGVPFQPFGRNPQIRLTQNIGKSKFIVVANSQRDYSSRGPAGVTGNYLRNSGIPELSLQFHIKPIDAILFGMGASYKQIMPQTKTPVGYQTNETVGGYNAFAFLRINTKPVTIKAQGIYGQNIPDVLSIGGIAISDTLDAAKGFVAYTTMNTMSSWIDISTNGKKWQFGVFGGYTKNLGTTEKVIGPIYGLGTNIESLYRISPRVSVKFNKLKFALEGEYTTANYGASRDEFGVPTDITPTSNLRVLFASYYFF